MKKLQNNFTTPEQSERLLVLGVPADSADCYYYEPFGKHNFIYILQNGSPLKETERRQRIIVHPDTKLFPCWSVGRLIEIYELCTGYEWHNKNGNKVELLMADYQNHKHLFDFSKLED